MKISEDKFRVMVDTIPALVWCTLPDGSNEFHNQRWHDYTGLPEGAETGWGWKVAYHPEDLERLLNEFQSIVASGAPGEMEARLRRFDGEYRWFVIRAAPFRDETGKILYWYGSSTDIEDRKRAEEKLRQDERELRRITDAIPQMIFVHDSKGTPLHANRAVLDYTGLTVEDVTTSNFPSESFIQKTLRRCAKNTWRRSRGAFRLRSRNARAERTASIAGSSSASTRSTTKRDNPCGGMGQEPTSKIANG
jgi:PAS domain S-box-containing protein